MFLKNLRSFEKKNPRGAALLAITQTNHLIFCCTKKGEKNLYNKITKDYYHDQEGISEAFSPDENTTIVVHYGLGLGYTFLASRSWLQEDGRRQLIILESDLAVISRFLETNTAKEFFHNPQAHLYYLEKGKEEEVFEEIVWGLSPQKFTFSISSLYQKTRAKSAQRIENELFLKQREESDIIYEYYVAGIPFYSNFWNNLSYLPESSDGSKLFNEFKGIPVICVVAGPSLQSQIELLREAQDRAIIIAGGSAINILSAHGITPHFGATCDPNRSQYVRFRENRAFEMPIFYRLRSHYDALRVASGKKLYLKGSDGFTTEDFFVKRNCASNVRVAGEHGVSNLIIYLAYALGARDIALAGYDLSYTDGKKYAQGVSVGADEYKDEERIPWVDYKGTPIQTEWKWISEARWISGFKKDHPRVRLYNVTPSGLAIDYVKRISFNEFLSKIKTSSQDVLGLIHSKLSVLPKLRCTQDIIRKDKELFRKSFVRGYSIICAMEALFIKKKGKVFSSVEYSELEEQLKKEKVYKYFLIMFDKMHTKLDHFRRRIFLHDSLKKAEVIRRDVDITYAHILFLKNVVQVNLRLLEERINEV